MKKIALIQGHPNLESYNQALGAQYREAAEAAGAEVREINIAEMDFDPNLGFGYSHRTPLEACLEDAWKIIKWADHLVIVYPTWWGTLPAKLKGFFDRLFLPGMAFQPRENSPFWDKLLKGKSARVITTMDSPGWYFWLVYRNSGYHLIKRVILNYCGVSPVRITRIGAIRNSTSEFREKQLRRVAQLGRRLR